MGYDHNRLMPLPREGGQETVKSRRRSRVKVPRRLVRQQQPRLRRQCPRDRDALRLATGQLRRHVLGAIREAHRFEQRARTRARQLEVPARQEQRHHHVLLRGELGQQVMELEHEPQQPHPQPAALRLVEPRQLLPAQLERALVGLVGVPRTFKSVLFPVPDAPTIAEACHAGPEVEPAQHLQPAARDRVGLADTARGQGRGRWSSFDFTNSCGSWLMCGLSPGSGSPRWGPAATPARRGTRRRPDIARGRPESRRRSRRPRAARAASR